MMTTEHAVASVWRRLGQIRRFHFTAEPGPRSGTGWRGAGDGRVETDLSGDHCIFHESGDFRPAGSGRLVAFTNTYHWQRVDRGRLRLSHGRRGPDALVFLFDLVADGGGGLVCLAPHACGADFYHGAAALTETGLTLRWTITGPRKDESLSYRYDA
jgi:hypothetical protein